MIASKAKIVAELAALYARSGGLDPVAVHAWAKTHKTSALHARLDWDDSSAAYKFRLWQIREIITEVEVVYPDQKTRQIYVSPLHLRGRGGYVSLVDVLSDNERRASFLAQALAEYERVGEKYADLAELAGVRAAVSAVARTTKSG